MIDVKSFLREHSVEELCETAEAYYAHLPAEELMVHDASATGNEQVVPDHLREAAAAHYGGMVTMCVACHNRFRPQATKE